MRDPGKTTIARVEQAPYEITEFTTAHAQKPHDEESEIDGEHEPPATVQPEEHGPRHQQEATQRQKPAEIDHAWRTSQKSAKSNWDELTNTVSQASASQAQQANIREVTHQ